MKAIVTTTFEINVSNWYKDERLTKKEKIYKLKEEPSDFSVFMLHFEYRNFKNVKIKIK